MTVGRLNRRTLVFLAAGLAALLLARFGMNRQSTAPVTAGDSIQAAEARLARLRRLVSMIPAKETELKRVRLDLAGHEKGMIAAETAAQAQAQLVEIVRRVAQKEGIDARGAEELRIRPLSSDYAEVQVTVTFTCGIEQFVNMLAALANEPQIVATNEMHVTAGNPKEKNVQVRMSFSGLVPAKLIPKRQALGAF
jgi:hypothetical protein